MAKYEPGNWLEKRELTGAGLSYNNKRWILGFNSQPKCLQQVDIGSLQEENREQSALLCKCSPLGFLWSVTELWRGPNGKLYTVCRVNSSKCSTLGQSNGGLIDCFPCTWPVSVICCTQVGVCGIEKLLASLVSWTVGFYRIRKLSSLMPTFICRVTWNMLFFVQLSINFLHFWTPVVVPFLDLLFNTKMCQIWAQE